MAATLMAGLVVTNLMEPLMTETTQLIQHSASLSGGTSGSPMFLSDGTVIVSNSRHRIAQQALAKHDLQRYGAHRNWFRHPCGCPY